MDLAFFAKLVTQLIEISDQVLYPDDLSFCVARSSLAEDICEAPRHTLNTDSSRCFYVQEAQECRPVEVEVNATMVFFTTIFAAVLIIPLQHMLNSFLLYALHIPMERKEVCIIHSDRKKCKSSRILLSSPN